MKKERRTPLATTDIIIEHAENGHSGIVLITRKNPPYGLALPGGFAEYGISLEDNARKEAMEETGLDILIETPELPLCVHSDPKRDPRGHMISVTYVAKGIGTMRAGDDAKTAKIYTINEVQDILSKGTLCFDHSRSIEKYLAYRGITNETIR